MDMLRTFFELSEEDTSRYFTDKKIWACGEAYRSYQGKYPVIFLTFKDVKCETWEETYDLMTKLIRQEFKRHSELAASNVITNLDYYQKMENVDRLGYNQVIDVIAEIQNTLNVMKTNH